jgi:hypothetical protein
MVYDMGVGKISKFGVLEDSLKKSFSNVRMDIISIKDYLEKQHDMLNSEISELQSQIITLNKDVSEKTRELGEHASKEELAAGLEGQKELFRDLVKQNRELEAKLTGFERAVVKLQAEKAGSNELTKKSAEFSRESRDIRNEMYREIEQIDRKFKDTKLEMSAEQEKIFNQKMKQLDRSITAVDELKKELRIIIRDSRNKGSVQPERLAKLETKVADKSFFARLKADISDFLFEEEPVEEEKVAAISPVPKRKAAAPRGKEKRSAWNWIILIIVLLLIAGLAYLIFSGRLAPLMGSIMAAVKGPGTEENATGEPGQNLTKNLQEPIISVNEGDFVDITPNISDPDNDNVIYAFSAPLDASGKWQTKKGDAGIYPMSVIVSDGATDTQMNFTLIVKAKQ